MSVSNKVLISFRRYSSAGAVLTLLLLNSCGVFESAPNTMSEVRTLAGTKKKIGEPFGIAVRGDETFVSDGQKGMIWKIARSGEIAEFAKGLDTPSHIAFDDPGNLYVADSGANTIIRIDGAGKKTIIAGINGKSGFKDGKAEEALFSGPIGIAVEGARVFVSDTYNDRIRVIEKGLVSTIAGSNRGFRDSDDANEVRFDTPCGLVFYKDRLYAADAGNRRIRVIEKDGSTRTAVGGGSDSADGLPGSAGLDMPVDVEFDSTGALFVADGNRMRAVGRRFVTLTETVAGKDRGFQDGPARLARFNRIGGIGIDGEGNLLVADSDNSLVRILTGFSRGEILGRVEFEKTVETPSGFRKGTPSRWPFENPEKTREIAGTVGEIRGSVVSPDRVNAGFHNGLDIVGGYGEAAYAIRDEKVLRPLAVGEFKTQREFIRFPAVGYVHLRLGRDQEGKPFGDSRFRFEFDENERVSGLRIPRGTAFKAGDQLGTLNSMNHIHLVTGLAGREYNGLVSLNLPGVSDSRPPVLEKIALFDKNWREIEQKEDVYSIKRGSVFRITAEAFDQMDGNADRRKLGLFRLGFRILDESGKPLKSFEKTNWTITFDGTPDRDGAGIAYAFGSSSGATGTTVFRYIVSNKVSGSRAREIDRIADFEPGDYTLEVTGEDYFGNSTTGEVRLRIE